MNTWKILPDVEYSKERQRQADRLIDLFVEKAQDDGCRDQTEIEHSLKYSDQSNGFYLAAAEFMRDGDEWKAIKITDLTMQDMDDLEEGQQSISGLIDRLMFNYFWERFDVVGRINYIVSCTDDPSPFRSEADEHRHFDNIDRARDMNSI